MRIGIYGGTFDPIHIGHLILANLAKEELHLDRVVFVPAFRPPHKENSDHPVHEFSHRLRMVELAIQDIPHFEVSNMEEERAGLSYTYDTLYELSLAADNRDDLIFLCGADSLSTITTWYRAHDLLQYFALGVFKRPSYKVRESIEHLRIVG